MQDWPNTWFSPRRLVIVALLMTLAFSLVSARVLLEMRHGEGALAKQSLENLAATIDSDISRNIEIYDLSLRNVATNVIEPSVMSLTPELQHLVLFDHAATARHFGAIRVYDANGNLMLDSDTLNAEKENVASEDYFTAHKDSADADLFIGKPGVYRTKYSVVLSRRISSADGKFFGVVVGSLRFSYFHELFGRLNLNPEDSITVLRHDGTIVMRHPFILERIGQVLSLHNGIKYALAQASGSEVRRSSLDGVERLYVWHDSRHPLIVIVGRSLETIYGMWQRQVIKIGGVLAALAFSVALATYFLAREMTLRTVAEKRLAQMANTDGLTKLKNRRHFDRVLEAEWRRARLNQPLSLLMIDADHFKTFNDMFGHQAGDQVLIRIADCIAVAAKREGDCAARYGGEEFALILPRTDLPAALQIA